MDDRGWVPSRNPLLAAVQIALWHAFRALGWAVEQLADACDRASEACGDLSDWLDRRN